MTRISFDLPDELHQQFKLYCAENKCSMTDKITEYIKQTLEKPKAENNPQSQEAGTKPSDDNPGKAQKTVIVDGKEYIIDDLDVDLKITDDLDEPVSETATTEKKIVDVLTSLVPNVAVIRKDLNDLIQWREDFRGWQDSKFADLEAALKEIDRKFVITGSLVESVMNAVEETSSATKCEDDLKGIAVLKGEVEKP